MSLNKIGYYKSWDLNNLPPENIDVRVYSHINYAFCEFDSDGNLALAEQDKNTLRRLSSLKQCNRNIKLLISIGGWNAGSNKFSKIAASVSKTENLADSSISVFRSYNFDGLDIDWEYPGKRDGSSSDRDNFVKMLRLIKNKFRCDYLLTAAVSPLADPASYDIKGISDYVDFINVMTYDFHQGCQGKTGHNAPLYKTTSDSDWEKENCNCDAAISKWLRGAPSRKLVLGLAFYGQVFHLASSKHGVCAPTYKEESQKTYKEISKLKWSDDWDPNSQVPFKYSSTQWIGYDNEQSIGLKVQYAKNNRLGGVMVWAINDDNVDLDLTKAIKRAA